VMMLQMLLVTVAISTRSSKCIAFPSRTSTT